MNIDVSTFGTFSENLNFILSANIRWKFHVYHKSTIQQFHKYTLKHWYTIEIFKYSIRRNFLRRHRSNTEWRERINIFDLEHIEWLCLHVLNVFDFQFHKLMCSSTKSLFVICWRIEYRRTITEFENALLWLFPFWSPWMPFIHFFC